jgi:hypothetical protein
MPAKPAKTDARTKKTKLKTATNRDRQVLFRRLRAKEERNMAHSAAKPAAVLSRRQAATLFQRETEEEKTPSAGNKLRPFERIDIWKL